jgi:hypothetical protein
VPSVLAALAVAAPHTGEAGANSTDELSFMWLTLKASITGTCTACYLLLRAVHWCKQTLQCCSIV